MYCVGKGDSVFRVGCVYDKNVYMGVGYLCVFRVGCVTLTFFLIVELSNLVLVGVV